MRTQQLSDALDRCLILLTEEGATVEECLARYPQHAAELGPLLETAVKIERVPPVAASPSAVAAGKSRMLMALEEKKRRQSMELSHAAESGLLSGLKERITAWLAGDDGRGWQPTPVPRIALAGAALLALILVGSLLLPSWLEPGVTGMATLELTSGGVEVRAAGDDVWLDALPGQPLEAGARIRTGTVSAARLAFFDGSVTVLEADTELSIRSLKSQEDSGPTTIILDQRRGRTQHRVVPMLDPGSRFEVRSPEAVTVVRGTEFVVVVEEDGTTDVTVREGLVEVRARSIRSERIELRPGWAISVQPSEPPETARAVPTPLPLEDIPLLKQQVAETPLPSATPTLVPQPSPTDTPVPTVMPEPTETEEPRKPQETSAPKPSPTPVPPMPTATLEPTVTPEPTATPPMPPTSEKPKPTATPRPTATREPTATVEPTATPPIPPTSETETPPVPPTSEQGANGSPASPTPEVVQTQSATDERDKTTDGGVSLASVGAQDLDLQSQPVGGITLRPRVLGLLVPWAGLLGLILVGGGLIAFGRQGA
jgi:ferric-dicitrate binding protein FerR (iron transport regulator)